MTAVPPHDSHFSPNRSTVQDQIEYLGDELTRLEGKTLSADATKNAVAAGMTQAVGSPEFWDAAFKAMGQRTTAAAGGFVLGGVRGIFGKVFWLAMAGLAVYIAGGWGALVSLFKLVFGVEAMKP